MVLAIVKCCSLRVVPFSADSTQVAWLQYKTATWRMWRQWHQQSFTLLWEHVLWTVWVAVFQARRCPKLCVMQTTTSFLLPLPTRLLRAVLPNCLWPKWSAKMTVILTMNWRVWSGCRTVTFSSQSRPEIELYAQVRWMMTHSKRMMRWEAASLSVHPPDRWVASRHIRSAVLSSWQSRNRRISDCRWKKSTTGYRQTFPSSVLLRPVGRTPSGITCLWTSVSWKLKKIEDRLVYAVLCIVNMHATHVQLFWGCMIYKFLVFCCMQHDCYASLSGALLWVASVVVSVIFL